MSLKKKKSQYEKIYLKPETVLTVNIDPSNLDDNGLRPIDIPLPKCPPLNTIDGYGLPPKEQKFTRQNLPVKLVNLQKKKLSLPEYYKTIKEDGDNYKDEIKFIEKQWEIRKSHYWFFNNGTPTCITGLHYFFLNWWQIDTGFPKYIDRQRKHFWFTDFCMNDPFCLGELYPKMRQEGATTTTACWLFERMSRVMRKQGGIQSKDYDSAYNVFKRMIDSWRRLPFFFQPLFEGTNNPKNELSFYAPAQKIGSMDTISFDDIVAIESTIDYGDSDPIHYDGATLYSYYGDEVFKLKEFNAYTRHQKVMPGVKKGKGKMMYTSTVGEILKDNIEIAKELCRDSLYHKKEKDGTTKSGLYCLFISSDEGYDDGMISFIDEYGISKKAEARQHILKKIDSFEKNGQHEQAAEIRRQYPLQFIDCFAVATKDCSFNLSILNQITGKYVLGNPYKTKGNFEWRGGVKDSYVDFIKDPNGKFLVSWLYDTPEKSNKSIIQENTNMPIEFLKKYYEFYSNGIKLPGAKTKGIIGSDAFRYRNTEGVGSMGGGAGFLRFDSSIDDINSPVETWKTHRFIFTYSNRPSPEDYVEDMIKACVYYGFPMYPENNIDMIEEGFARRGYWGYLLFHRNINGKVNNKSGGYTTDFVKEEMFREYQQYIDKFAIRDPHDELWEDCKVVTPKTTTRFDRFMACGYALLGAKRDMVSDEFNNELNSEYDIESAFPNYTW